jgi:hypothetical protein
MSPDLQHYHVPENKLDVLAARDTLQFIEETTAPSPPRPQRHGRAGHGRHPRGDHDRLAVFHATGRRCRSCRFTVDKVLRGERGGRSDSRPAESARVSIEKCEQEWPTANSAPAQT